jgi:transcriptional regulator with XRE-family HTH domain
VIGDIQAIFGHNLRHLRLTRGWTRKELGEMLGGYGEAYIGAIERGERNLRAQTMDLLSELAGVGPSDLLLPPPEWAELRAAASGGDPTPRPRPKGTGPRRPSPPDPS